MTSYRVPPAELGFQFVRSSGAGGQNVNKVASKVVLRWNVATSRALPEAVRRRFLERWASRIRATGEIVLSGSRHRDQPRNIADCVERLHEMIAAVSSPPKPRHPTRPTRGSVERRLEAKRARAQTRRRRGVPETD